jgi:cell wall-associated NlpC family hydrolase
MRRHPLAAFALLLALTGAFAVIVSAPGAAAPQAAPRAAVTVQLDSYSAPAARHLTLRQKAWRFAYNHRGDWYQYGAAGPSTFDCSGLQYRAYLSNGINIGRDTYDMLANRRLIRVAHPKLGDLAFFGSGHVEMYVSPGWTIGAQQTGTRVGFHHWSASWHPTAFYRVT